MKDSKRFWLGTIALALVAIVSLLAAQYFYYRVDGEEISRHLKSGNIVVVKLKKTIESSSKSELCQEVTLTEPQVEMLISLMNQTKFKRITSKTVSYDDRERYLLTAENAKTHVIYRLESYGGEFILVDSATGDSPPEYWKLRISNPDWKRTIEAILTASD